MAAPNKIVVIDDMSGGMNWTDPPFGLKPTECYEAVNVEWVRNRFGRRRRGTSIIGQAFVVPTDVFTTPIGSMVRHVPGTDEAAAEVWAVDSTPIFARKAGSPLFQNIIPQDALTGNAWDVTWATVDGCLFVAYQSAVNRLHVWDGFTLRRTGISAGNPGVIAPVTDTGVGAYPAVERQYRVRWWNSFTGLISEPTPVQVFTPSGTGIGARIPRPPPPGEGENWWIVEAAEANDATFYQIGQVPIATLFFDDLYLPSDYALPANNFTVSPLTGTVSLQKSYRFLAGAENRLLGYGTFEVGVNVKQNRIEISGIVGGTTVGAFGNPIIRAAETVNTTAGFYIDLDDSDSGPATGLKGPVLGNYYAFKAREMWELRPTGDSTRPFAATAISKTIGAVSHQSIVVSEDRLGRGALYFWSAVGPYRYTVNGLEYIGHNVEGHFKGAYGIDVNLDATIRIVHGVPHLENRQVWWWVTYLGFNEPQILLVYHTETGAWTEFTGWHALARCSAVLPAVQGATMSRVLKPCAALQIQPVPGSRLVRADDEAAVQDAGAQDFVAKLAPRPVLPGGPGQMGNVGDVQILANGPGVNLFLETFKDLSDYAPTTKTTSVNLTASSEEHTRWVYRKFEGSGLGEVLTAHYRIRDLNQAPWEGIQLVIPVRPQGAVTW